MTAHPHDVTGFWRAAGPAKWFAKGNRFDDAIRLKFEPVHFAPATRFGRPTSGKLFYRFSEISVQPPVG